MSIKRNLILAVESSCDETSVAVVEDGTIVHSNIVGEAKDSYGDATNDHSKQAEGKAQKAKGAVEKTVGKAKKRLR